MDSWALDAASTKGSMENLRPTATKLQSEPLKQRRAVSGHQQALTPAGKGNTASLIRFKPTPTSRMVTKRGSSSVLVAEETRMKQTNETNVLDLRVDDDDGVDDDDDDVDAYRDASPESVQEDLDAGDAEASGDDEDDDDEDASMRMVDEIMESTGLSRPEVEELLGEYKETSKGSKKKKIPSIPPLAAANLREDQPQFFVTETPEIPERITTSDETTSALQNSPPWRKDRGELTPRERQNTLLDEFLPSNGVSTSHRQANYDAEMELIAQQRDERKRKKEQAVKGYLAKRRGTVEAPTSLTDRTPFVEKYETEMRQRREQEASKRRQKLESEKEERRERRLKGFFSNMAIQEKIEAAKRKKDATATTKSAQSPPVVEAPSVGNVAPFVSDDCGETIATMKDNK